MVKVRIDGKDFEYSDEDLSNMSIEQLKQLKRDLQVNVQQVSVKKAKYNAENEEEWNSKEYLKQINKFKGIIFALNSSIAKVSKYEKSAVSELYRNQEHWLWNFYKIVKNSVGEKKFRRFVEETDEKSNYHVEVKE